jgi:hypothetical protein
MRWQQLQSAHKNLPDMKRITVLAVATSLTFTPAVAAPKSIALQLGSIYSAPSLTEAFILSGKSAVFLSNVNSKSADVVLTAFDQSGTQIWQCTIDSGVDEVATAITADPLGNIWIAGSSALSPTVETPTAITGIDNPDSVIVDGGNSLRTDINQITLWKVSPSGELLATSTLTQKSIPTINSLSATNSGVSIIGSIDGKSFLLNFAANQFGKVILIGTSKTELNSVARNSDGSSSIFGSSAETLVGKKVAGIRDGILLKISKSGSITSLVRSSAIKASRSWISGDSSHLVTGPVITGKVTETAVTKFSSTFAPTWTSRYSSTGPSVSVSANGNSYLAFTSKSSIAGITGWKPSAPALLVITFDSKGVIKAATALPGLITPISLAYSPVRGVTGLASSADGTVSIFTLVSR